MRVAATIFAAILGWSGACQASTVTLVTVNASGGSAVFVDRSTIKTDGNLRTAWFFNVSDAVDPTDGYDVMKGQETIDCVNNTTQVTYITAYSPTDQVIWSSPLNGEPTPLRPGSMNAAKRNFVCDGKLDPKLNFEVDSGEMRKVVRGLVVVK